MNLLKSNKLKVMIYNIFKVNYLIVILYFAQYCIALNLR